MTDYGHQISTQKREPRRKMNAYFPSQCPLQIFRVINKSSKEKHLLLLYNIVRHLLEKKGGSFCTWIIRKLRTTQKIPTKSIKYLDHYKRIFGYYCCYFKDNNLHFLKRWEIRQDVFSTHSNKRRYKHGHKFPIHYKYVSPNPESNIWQTKESVSLSYPVDSKPQIAWSHTVKQDDNISMVKKHLKSVSYKLCSTEHQIKGIWIDSASTVK